MLTKSGSQIIYPPVISLEDSPVARTLFSDVRWAWIWLILRLYVGWEWVQAGLGKLRNPAWTGSQAGSALSGFINNTLTKTGGMIKSPTFDGLRQGREKRDTKKLTLAGFAHPQEHNIRAALRQLAQALWPDQHWLGLIPVHDYRIRHQVDHLDYVWWVEHDIPPFDRYRCATYRVILTLNDQQNPVWFVQSGSKSYEFSDPASVSFERALALAGQDPPLIIPRKMGPALD